MKQKQIIYFLVVVCMTTALVGTDHFTSTTGDIIVQSKNNDVTILADTGGSTGKINIQAGTTTPGTTTPGDIGLSAANDIILKSIAKIILDAPIVEEISNTDTYTSAIASSNTTLGSLVSGNLVVTNDITIDADLTVNGDMFVLGGSITVNSGIKLQVKGTLLCDGQEVSGKIVNILGNLYGATASDHGVETLIIRNYNPGTDVDPVSISGTVVANKNILLTSNQASGASRSGLVLSGTVSSYGAMICSHNIGSGRYGVDVLGVLESLTEDIIFTENVAGGVYPGVVCRNNSVTAFRHIIFKSNSATGTGNGVSVETTCTVTAGVDVRAIDNVGNNSIRGGFNVEVAGTTITAGRDVYFKNNMNNASGQTVYIHVGTTVTAGNNVVFDEATTLSSAGLVKSGTINGDVVINGNFVVQAATAFEDNLTVNGSFTMSTTNATLTIGKSLYTVGGSVTINNGTATLTATDDIVFDGNNVDSTTVLFNPAVINGRDIVIRNFTTSSVSTLIEMVSTTTLTAANDIIIENNNKTNSNFGVFFNSGSMSLNSHGRIIIRNNSCSTQPGVYLLAGSFIAQGDVDISYNTGANFGVFIRFSFTALQGSNIYLTDNYSLNTNPGLGIDIQFAPVLGSNGTITNGDFWVARNRSTGGVGASIGNRIFVAHRMFTLGNTATGYNVENTGNFREYFANDFITTLATARQYDKTNVPTSDFPS